MNSWQFKTMLTVQIEDRMWVVIEFTNYFACIYGSRIYHHGIGKVKVKQSHYVLDRPRGFQEVEAPRFQDNRHMKVVRLSALRIGHLYPQEIFLVLISVRG